MLLHQRYNGRKRFNLFREGDDAQIMRPCDAGSRCLHTVRLLHREQFPALKSPPQRPIAQTAIALDSLAIFWLDATRTDGKQPARQQIQRQAEGRITLSLTKYWQERCYFNNAQYLADKNLISHFTLNISYSKY